MLSKLNFSKSSWKFGLFFLPYLIYCLITATSVDSMTTAISGVVKSTWTPYIFLQMVADTIAYPSSALFSGLDSIILTSNLVPNE